MHTLKLALGKQDKDQKSVSRVGYSMRNYNKSKSESMWALDPDLAQGEADNQEDLQTRKVGQALSAALKSAYQKQKIFSQIIFYDIVQNIQVLMGEDKAEIDCLLLMQKKIKDIIDHSKEDTKNFNVSFYELLVKRIKKLKKKEKKDQLQQYDRIIHTNFKKKQPVQYINEDVNNKQQYLEIKDNKLNKNMKGSGTFNSNDGSSSKKSNSNSNEGKLKGLLSQDKFKQESHKNQKQNQSVVQANESVSFSAVMSQSMAVRQRAPRNVPNKKQKAKQQNFQMSHHHQGHNQEDGDQDKDEAFIFFRPKKPTKKGGKY